MYGARKVPIRPPWQESLGSTSLMHSSAPRLPPPDPTALFCTWYTRALSPLLAQCPGGDAVEQPSWLKSVQNSHLLLQGRDFTLNDCSSKTVKD